jgi:hypothetical protein
MMFVSIFVVNLQTTFCQKLSVEKKHGTFTMILKAYDEVCNGSSRHLHDTSKSQMKTLLITFFDIKDIVHFEFISQGQTVNQAYYVEILKRLREAVCRKRPELWPNDWILHHDSAPAHKVPSVKQFLTQQSITEMEHPPYFHLICLEMTSGCFQK